MNENWKKEMIINALYKYRADFPLMEKRINQCIKLVEKVIPDEQ